MLTNQAAITFELIKTHLLKCNAEKIGIFGSYARMEHEPESDIDVLVRFNDRKSLLELVQIERRLSELTGVKVDLLTEKSISPLLKNRIKQEEKVLYEQQER